MKKILLLLPFLTSIIFAQSNFNLIVLNEGYYDYTNEEIVEPVSIGVYNSVAQTYEEIEVIDGVRFASDMIVDGDFLYVAADNKILKYQIGSFELLDEVEVQGVRNLLIHNDNLFVSRGDSENWAPVLFESYLQIFDKNNFNFISQFDTISGPKWSTQNLVSKDDQVFVEWFPRVTLLLLMAAICELK